MDKRTINVSSYVEEYADWTVTETGMYWMNKDQLTLLLKTYGKELLLEAAERAELLVISNEEYVEEGEKVPDNLYEYECGSDTVIVDMTSITALIDEL